MCSTGDFVFLYLNLCHPSDHIVSRSSRREWQKDWRNPPVIGVSGFRVLSRNLSPSWAIKRGISYPSYEDQERAQRKRCTQGEIVELWADRWFLCEPVWCLLCAGFVLPKATDRWSSHIPEIRFEEWCNFVMFQRKTSTSRIWSHCLGKYIVLILLISRLEWMTLGTRSGGWTGRNTYKFEV